MINFLIEINKYIKEKNIDIKWLLFRGEHSVLSSEMDMGKGRFKEGNGIK
jgi:hypothetical protein